MTIYVVSDSKSVRSAFAAVERSRTYTVEFAATSELTQVLKRSRSVPESFLYLDVATLDARTAKRRMTSLGKERPFQFGIVDSNHSVDDIAEVFHNSASDYVGKTLIGRGISTARLRRVVEYDPAPHPRRTGNHVPEHEHHRLIPSGSDWSSVEPGSEYTFIMLYAAIDQAGDLQRKSSEGFLASLRKSFTALLERSFAEFGARVWMWKEDEGLMLMPFDGEEVAAIVPALRLVLNRVLINVEEFAQFGDLSWRLALHLGNTTYRTSGRTGDIVAESVNFLFHLGARFVDPGGLAVTGPCYELIPARLRALLNHKGTFESVHVFTLRDLL